MAARVVGQLVEEDTPERGAKTAWRGTAELGSHVNAAQLS